MEVGRSGVFRAENSVFDGFFVRNSLSKVEGIRPRFDKQGLNRLRKKVKFGESVRKYVPRRLDVVSQQVVYIQVEP